MGNNVDDINSVITLFKQLKEKGTNKHDITEFYNTPIEDIIGRLEHIENNYKSSREHKQDGTWDIKNLENGADLMEHNDQFTTLSIPSFKAMRKYGCNTEACVVGSQYYFDLYSQNGQSPIYLVLTKHGNKLFITELTIHDEHNTELVHSSDDNDTYEQLFAYFIDGEQPESPTSETDDILGYMQLV
jgi:hypothetical protein